MDLTASTQRPSKIRRDKDIDGFWVRLYFLSRDRKLVFSVAGAIFAAAVLLAWLLRGPSLWEETAETPVELLKAQLSRPAPNMDEVLSRLAEAASQNAPVADIVHRIEQSRLTALDQEVALAYWTSLATRSGEANADLLILAHQADPAPRSNALIAGFYQRSGDVERAANYLAREAECSGSPAARVRLIDFLLRQRRIERLVALEGRPEYAASFTASARLRVALYKSDWNGVMRAVRDAEWDTFKPMPLTLAIVATLAWLAIALQAIQPAQTVCFRTLIPLSACAAGVIGALCSRVLAPWQEQFLAMPQAGEFLERMIRFFAGVAPREELIKLFFASLFLPALMKRGSRLEMLVAPGCVGLGFAFEDMLQYYQEAGPAAGFGRFLTAGFFHLATTGLAGLAVAEFAASPRTRAGSLLSTVGGMILIHGIYAAFMGVPGLWLLSIASILAFIVLMLVFFDQLHSLRDPFTDQLSLSATLLCGISLLTGAILICTSSQLGFALAAASLSANILSLGVIVLVFYRQLGRTSGLEHVGETSPLENDNHPYPRVYGAAAHDDRAVANPA